MSVRLALPLNQQRHSNVAIVRYRHDGVTLEVPCYKNKVLAFRQGLESSLDEVLQINRVFTNVSRGEFASNDDIKKALNLGKKKMSDEAVIRKILEVGEVQVGADERKEEEGVLRRDVVSIVAQKCIHPVTRRPYPFSIIENALTSIGFGVRLDQDAKPQALRAMNELCLKQVLPIRRAPMRIRICTSKPLDAVELLKKIDAENIFVRPLLGLVAPNSGAESSSSSTAENNNNNNSLKNNATTTTTEDVVADISPELFRQVDQWVSSSTEPLLPKGSSVTVIIPCVVDTSEGDASAITGVDASAIASALPKNANNNNNNSKLTIAAASSTKNVVDEVPSSSTVSNESPTPSLVNQQHSSIGKSKKGTNDNGEEGINNSEKKLTAKQRAQLRRQNKEQQQNNNDNNNPSATNHNVNSKSNTSDNTGSVHNIDHKKKKFSASSDDESGNDDDDDDEASGKKKHNNKRGQKKNLREKTSNDNDDVEEDDSDDSDAGLTAKEKLKKQKEKERLEQERRERELEEDEEAWKDGAGDDDDDDVEE